MAFPDVRVRPAVLERSVRLSDVAEQALQVWVAAAVLLVSEVSVVDRDHPVCLGPADAWVRRVSEDERVVLVDLEHPVVQVQQDAPLPADVVRLAEAAAADLLEEVALQVAQVCPDVQVAQDGREPPVVQVEAVCPVWQGQVEEEVPQAAPD